MSGMPIKSSVNADQTRVDFLDLSHWGRAVMKDIDFFEVGGQTVFPIYGASGGISASFIFYFDTGFQVWNDSPRSGSYIDSLARPSGLLRRACRTRVEKPQVPQPALRCEHRISFVILSASDQDVRHSRAQNVRHGGPDALRLDVTRECS